MNPPDELNNQLQVYLDERAEDQEEYHERLTRDRRPRVPDDPELSELVELARQHPELYPVLIAAVRQYLQVVDRDIDE